MKEAIICHKEENVKLFVVEAAVKKDFEKIKKLVLESKLSADDLSEENKIFIVKNQLGEIVGCVSYEKTIDDWIHIQSLAVKKEYRNKGIGKKLILNLIENLKEAGENGPIIALTLFWNNDFYRKLGFEHLNARAVKNHDSIAKREKHKYCVAWGINAPIAYKLKE